MPTPFLVEVANDLEDLGHDLWGEAHRRLIEQQHVRRCYTSICKVAKDGDRGGAFRRSVRPDLATAHVTDRAPEVTQRSA
jgi:hypothetical protein